MATLQTRTAGTIVIGPYGSSTKSLDLPAEIVAAFVGQSFNVEAAAFTNGLITIQKVRAFGGPNDGDIPFFFYQESFVTGPEFPAPTNMTMATLNSGAALRIVCPFPPANWSVEVRLAAHPTTVRRDPMVDLVIGNMTRLNDALVAAGSLQTVTAIHASGEPYLPLTHVLVTLSDNQAGQTTAYKAAHPREAIIEPTANNVLMIVPNHTTGNIAVLVKFAPS